jgi:transposase
VQCADPFHVVKWATEALDEVRRQAWNDARHSGQTKGKGYRNRVATGDARRFKGSRPGAEKPTLSGLPVIDLSRPVAG